MDEEVEFLWIHSLFIYLVLLEHLLCTKQCSILFMCKIGTVITHFTYEEEIEAMYILVISPDATLELASISPPSSPHCN